MASGTILANNIKLISFSKSYTISYNTDVNNLVDVPTGYTAVGVVRYDTGSSEVGVIATKQNALSLSRFRNVGTSGTFICTGYVLCARSDSVSS